MLKGIQIGISYNIETSHWNNQNFIDLIVNDSENLWNPYSINATWDTFESTAKLIRHHLFHNGAKFESNHGIQNTKENKH